MEFKDYYAILGASTEASVDELKRAYRKLARKYHPDVSKEPDAEKQFKEVNEAWEVLGDPQKKARYDQLRTHRGHPGTGDFQPDDNAYYQHFREGGSHAENVGDFSDFFNTIFGGAHPFTQHSHQHYAATGQDAHVKVSIPLILAYQGGLQTIQLQMPVAAAGKKESQTKSLNIKIPAGVTNGSQIRLKGQGYPGMGTGSAGDLYIEIAIQHHPFFSLHQKDIHLKLPITPWEAALGATISVPTLGGPVSLKIPSGAQSEQKLRLKGRGLPGQPPGDQYAILQIYTPKADSEKAKALYEQMAALMPFNPREKLGV